MAYLKRRPALFPKKFQCDEVYVNEGGDERLKRPKKALLNQMLINTMSVLHILITLKLLVVIPLLMYKNY